MYRFGLFVQIVFEVTGGTAFFVTIISFVLLNPAFTFWNGSLHFATSMFMLSELLMSDIPVRFDHYPINLSWALLYLIFIWPLTVMKTSPSPKWPYDVLDTRTAWCFLFYTILYIVDFVTYALWYGFHELKIHLIRRFDLGEAVAFSPEVELKAVRDVIPEKGDVEGETNVAVDSIHSGNHHDSKV
jgi:hypothetical protein